MKVSSSVIMLSLVVACAPLGVYAGEKAAGNSSARVESRTAETKSAGLDELSKEYEKENPEAVPLISDPVRPWNVACFHFNDKLYFWVLKPAGTGWRYFLYPRFTRIGVKNFIYNFGFTGRLFNNSFQAYFKDAGIEFVRFLTDTTLGVVGFWDPAERLFHLKPRDTDFDETLGRWRIGMGCYLTWPFFGPSSVRGTFGLIGDSAFDPIRSHWSFQLLSMINTNSLGENEYETLRQGALDPYVAIRSAYVQNRQKKISSKE